MTQRAQRHSELMLERNKQRPRLHTVPTKRRVRERDYATHVPYDPPAQVRTFLLTICQRFGISPDAIRNGRNHRREVIAARKRAVFDLRDMGFGKAQTARFLGIDHSSVTYTLGSTTPPTKQEELAFQNLSKF